MKINKKVSFDTTETIKSEGSIIMCTIMYKRSVVNGKHKSNIRKIKAKRKHTKNHLRKNP